MNFAFVSCFTILHVDTFFLSQLRNSGCETWSGAHQSTASSIRVARTRKTTRSWSQEWKRQMLSKMSNLINVGEEKWMENWLFFEAHNWERKVCSYLCTGLLSGGVGLIGNCWLFWSWRLLSDEHFFNKIFESLSIWGLWYFFFFFLLSRSFHTSVLSFVGHEMQRKENTNYKLISTSFVMEM